MNNKTSYIKIPDGFCYHARTKSLFNQSLNYLRLKGHNKSGFFSKKSTLQDLSSILHKSEAQSRRILNQLIKCKFIRVQSNGYVIISYNAFYKLLGYDMTKYVTKKGKVRLGAFKIHKKEYSIIDDLKLYVQYLDIIVNIKTQNQVVKNKICKKKGDKCPGPVTRKVLNSFGFVSNRDKLKGVMAQNQAQIVKLNNEAIFKAKFCEMQGKGNPNIDYINPDCTLSLRGIASLLQISLRSAYLLVEELRDKGYIDVVKREEFIKNCASYELFLSSYDPCYYRYHDGSIFRVLPNLISPLCP